jgi:hypothetical protein
VSYLEFERLVTERADEAWLADMCDNNRAWVLNLRCDARDLWTKSGRKYPRELSFCDTKSDGRRCL